MLPMGLGRVRSVICVATLVVVAWSAPVGAPADEAAKRRLLLRGPQGVTLTVEERPVDGNVGIPRAAVSANEFLIRSGICARAGKGVAYHVSGWGGAVDVTFDALRATTFAIESRKVGALKPVFCVHHRGARDLKFTTPRPMLVARATRLRSGALVVRAGEEPYGDVEFTLTPLRGGAATHVELLGATAGGSGGTVLHLRRGTCRFRPSSDEIPLGRGGVVRVAIPFASFGRGRWVVEEHTDLAGARIALCAEV